MCKCKCETLCICHSLCCTFQRRIWTHSAHLSPLAIARAHWCFQYHLMIRYLHVQSHFWVPFYGHVRTTVDTLTVSSVLCAPRLSMLPSALAIVQPTCSLPVNENASATECSNVSRESLWSNEHLAQYHCESLHLSSGSMWVSSVKLYYMSMAKYWWKWSLNARFAWYVWSHW